MVAGTTQQKRWAMNRSQQVEETLNLPDGVQVLPGTFQGLRGLPRGSQGGYWSPDGVTYPSGKPVQSWYCHGYKTADEHYHVNQPQMEECKRLRGEEVSYAD
jgi:hypothetical protein